MLLSLNDAHDQARLHLPRILCLHGGGVNSTVFRAQTRSFARLLPHFRLVFADAPFLCEAGPGVKPVYQDYGPFRRWLRWLPQHVAIDDEAAVEELMFAVEVAKKNDHGTGPWVGLLGFSQGAKVVVSLLYDQQIRIERTGSADTDYKFGVVMNGRAPIISLSGHSQGSTCGRAGAMSHSPIYARRNPHMLRIPTIHVHGLLDPDLDLHQELLEDWHDPRSTNLCEWEGGHRVPVKTADVEPITRTIYRVARMQGVKF